MDDLFEEPTAQSLGGLARAERLSPEKRSEIARRAAAARWADDDSVLKATHGSGDRPLVIGPKEIPCYVLEDGRRVLSLRGMLGALNLSMGSASRGEGDRLFKFATGRAIEPFLSNDLITRMKEPVRFRAPTGGSVATGYEATILPDLCDAVLEARKSGRLRKDQLPIADACELLVRAFARVGIIALVDEATGYQEVRDRRALEEILNKYISEELRQWTKTFPDEYFKQIFRLKGWSAPKIPTARPGVIASYTNDVVYARLAPGVLDELQRLNPSDGKGRRKHKNFQFLTADHGHPKLKDHLSDIVLLMSAATSWPEFKKLLDRVKPRVAAPGELDLRVKNAERRT
jgi:hypothetical protein